MRRRCGSAFSNQFPGVWRPALHRSTIPSLIRGDHSSYVRGNDCCPLPSPAYCVKLFNVRPYRYTGAVSEGDGLGYVLPLQDRFSGVTSHLELQMCDSSDPSHFL